MEPTQAQRETINHVVRAIYPLGWTVLANGKGIKVLDIETNTLAEFEDWDAFITHLRHEFGAWARNMQKELAAIAYPAFARQVQDYLAELEAANKDSDGY